MVIPHLRYICRPSSHNLFSRDDDILPSPSDSADELTSEDEYQCADECEEGSSFDEDVDPCMYS